MSFEFFDYTQFNFSVCYFKTRWHYMQVSALHNGIFKNRVNIQDRLLAFNEENNLFLSLSFLLHLWDYLKLLCQDTMFLFWRAEKMNQYDEWILYKLLLTVRLRDQELYFVLLSCPANCLEISLWKRTKLKTVYKIEAEN